MCYGLQASLLQLTSLTVPPVRCVWQFSLLRTVDLIDCLFCVLRFARLTASVEVIDCLHYALRFAILTASVDVIDCSPRVPRLASLSATVDLIVCLLY